MSEKGPSTSDFNALTLRQQKEARKDEAHRLLVGARQTLKEWRNGTPPDPALPVFEELFTKFERATQIAERQLQISIDLERQTETAQELETEMNTLDAENLSLSQEIEQLLVLFDATPSARDKNDEVPQ